MRIQALETTEIRTAAVDTAAVIDMAEVARITARRLLQHVKKNKDLVYPPRTVLMLVAETVKLVRLVRGDAAGEPEEAEKEQAYSEQLPARLRQMADTFEPQARQRRAQEEQGVEGWHRNSPWGSRRARRLGATRCQEGDSGG